MTTFNTSFTKLAFRTSFTRQGVKALKNMRLYLQYLIKAGLALIQGVILQKERSPQLNDVVNIFLVNDVLNVVI
jgi:hypothetical protein